MADITAIRNNNRIAVLTGHRRLSAQLQVHGFATVEIDGHSVKITKNDRGDLVQIQTNPNDEKV